MNVYRYLMAALIAFLLPWQTRWLLVTPTVGHSSWEFGITGLFVAEAALAIWLAQEAWNERAAARAWVRAHARVLGIFAALFVLQMIISRARLLTLQFFVQIFLLTGFALIFLAHKKIQRAVAGGFLLAAVLQALLGCVQVVAGASFKSTFMGIPERLVSQPGVSVIVANGTRFMRAYGGQPHPNIFGAFMLVALLAYVFVAREIQKKESVWQLTTLLTGALVFSFSRSAWAGYGIFLALCWWQREKFSDSQKRIAQISAGVALLMTIIFFPFIIGRVTAQGPLENNSITERVSGLHEWVGVARTHWLFGTGAGAYTTALTATEGYNLVPVHSAPLVLAAEFGLCGILFLAAALYVLREKKFSPFILILLPALLVDHFLYSLWAGQVLFMLTFVFAWSMVEPQQPATEGS